MTIDVKQLQQRIASLEKQIKDEDVRKAQIDGKLEALNQQLKRDFEVGSLEEAEQMLVALDEEIAEYEKTLRDLTSKLDDLLMKQA